MKAIRPDLPAGWIRWLLVPVLLAGTGCPSGEPPPPPPPPEDPVAAKIEKSLSRCRSYLAGEIGGEPNWEKAEASCNEALALDPLEPEANQLLKKARLEKTASDLFAKGNQALTRLREEEALELFGRIDKASLYYFKAKPKLQAAIDAVKKRTGDDCKRYVGDDHFKEALPRCEKHLEIACQTMSPAELYPPAGFKVVTRAGKLGKREWRPSYPMLLNFHKAREKADSKGPAWKCPVKSIFLAPATLAPTVDLAQVFGQRYPEKDLAEAMVLYAQGKIREAVVILMRVREHQTKAAVHATADDLRKQMTSIDDLYKQGQSNLQAEDPERAAEPFREALLADEKLMGLSVEKTPSYIRRNILQDMAQRSYEKGKLFADRQDSRRACKIWKLGNEFYKGNADLLRALKNVCTNRALEMVETASCTELEKVADFAVDRDGVKELIENRRAELQCP